MFNPEVLPAEFRAKYDRLSPEAQAKWQAQRLKAQTDHMFLAVDVLGMDFQETPHRIMFNKFLKKSEQETPLYDLDQATKRRLILWPRGTFKTSAVLVEVVQLIINYPNIAIGYLSGSQDLAIAQLLRIRQVFENPTPKFKQLFPEFCKDRLGSSKQFSVPCRTAGHTVAEPTMRIFTAASVKASSHYDVIFCDDLVNEQNYNNPKALAKSIQQYIDISPLLDPNGYMYVTGTRYSFDDCYEHIQKMIVLENEQFGRTIWKTSIMTCWSEMCKCGHPNTLHDSDRNYSSPPCTQCDCKQFNGTGEISVLFPEFRTKSGKTKGHTVEFLQREKLANGAEWFACQYENNPIGAGLQTFTPELIDTQTLLSYDDIPFEGVTFVLGDLSYVGKKESDMTVFFVCRMYQGQIYVFDCVFGKWDTEKICEYLLLITLRYRPRIIWIEKMQSWETFTFSFNMYALQRGIQKFPVEWLPMSNANNAKKIRIGSVIVPLKEGRLWLYGGMPGYSDLRTQLLRWPKLGNHDDFADTLGMVCNAPTGYHLEKVPTTQTPKEMWKKLHATKENENNYPDSGAGTGILC